jgi:hypothetical protein
MQCMRITILRTRGIVGRLAVLMAAVLASPLAYGQTVTKVVDDFQQSAWVPNQWNSATGQSSLVRESMSPASQPAAERKMVGILKMEAAFSGNGFEAFTVDPPSPLWIPGNAKTVSLRYKIHDKRYALKLGLSDGWGREQANGGNLAWDIRTSPSGEWETATFKVPSDWVRPLRITGLTTHNWEAQGTKIRIPIQIADLQVETDITDVDPKTGILTTWTPEPNKPAHPDKALKQCPPTPLVSVGMASGQQANIFTRTEPEVKFRLQNWKPGALTGTLTCRLDDAAGAVVDQFERPVTVETSSNLNVPLKAKRFGLYTLNARLTLSDGTQRAEKMTLARLPLPRELTEQQKLASPYGLNVHSGEKVVLVPFRNAGIVWFREYAFSFDWLLRAKGKDNSYAGWPYYPKIVQAYMDAGAECLPVIQQSIKHPEVVNGKVVGRIGPDRNWTREISSVIIAFPQITRWELSNEYDLPADNARAEDLIDWANYRAYHRQFANILDLLGGGELVAVENGRASIRPDRLARCIESGDFQRIGVVNTHQYCGTDAPEENSCNFNMGYEGKIPSLLFDDLRAVKRTAQADGKKRESWLTEFGWDTLAGPVVTPYQQAVYLPREWMLAMAAGTDKAFWFYNFDAPKPKQFFDGCGLLTANGEAKLALCSMAGLTNILPNPTYVGELNAGENTCGYVFRDGGKLIAALWTIQGDDGPAVHFQSGQLRDYLGNPVDGNAVRLTMAPVYLVGLNTSDVWYRQTAYSLDTPHLVPACGGDNVRPVVRIANNRGEPINCRLKLELPEGWKAESPGMLAAVAAGASKNIEMPFTIPFAAELGIKELKIIVSEGEELKRIPMKVFVRSPLSVEVSPIKGRPGKTQVTVEVGNHSSKAISGTLHLRLPASWKALDPDIQILDLRPQEVRPIDCKFQWDADWNPQETAQIELSFGADKRAMRPLIPNQYAIHRAKNIKLDGRLNDWGPAAQLPAWMLGCSAGKSGATVHLAWAKEGIYGAVAVNESKLLVKDPTSFWSGDAMELFVDTADNKKPRQPVAGDLHFWIVPLPDSNRVYLGQWKMQNEIPATRYDIPIQGVAKRTADGYVMEFLLPAALIKDYRPEVGGRLGLNLNLTIQGKQSNREAFWPGPKKFGAPTNPDRWGTALLLE